MKTRERPVWFWRKLTTRPVWWWERRRPYPVRAAWPTLPEVELGGSDAWQVAVLGTSATFAESMWSAWSLARFLGDKPASVTLYVDGEVDAGEIASADRVLRGVRIVSVRPFLMERASGCECFRRFLDHHPMAVKFLLGLFLQESRSTLYLDNDVVFFHSPGTLLDMASAGGGASPMYIQEHGDGCWDPRMTERIASLGLGIARSFNGGLLWMPRGCLDRGLAEELLRDWRPPVSSWFTEQTMNAALFERAGAAGLPRSEYVITNARQFYWEQDVDYARVVARHFTGPVRHVLYGAGYPWLLRSGDGGAPGGWSREVTA